LTRWISCLDCLVEEMLRVELIVQSWLFRKIYLQIRKLLLLWREWIVRITEIAAISVILICTANVMTAIG